MLTRRELIAVAATACLSNPLKAATPATRSFWVLKLLQPASLTVRAVGTARLHCSFVEGERIIEGSSALSLTPDSAPVRITGPDEAAVACVLEIPGVIRRSYFGTFEVFSRAGVIVPVVEIDCECATGSIAGAELPVDSSPLSGLAAQAVVSRSILCASKEPRHEFADFCDTTHCQFLRSPAAPGGKVSQAVTTTRGIVMAHGGRIFPARYSAACGGVTEAGLDGGFQYVSTPCEICRENGTVRRGHGQGLCQEGAIGLAQLGWNWRDILTKYYPNAAVSYAALLRE